MSDNKKGGPFRLGRLPSCPMTIFLYPHECFLRRVADRTAPVIGKILEFLSFLRLIIDIPADRASPHKTIFLPKIELLKNGRCRSERRKVGGKQGFPFARNDILENVTCCELLRLLLQPFFTVCCRWGRSGSCKIRRRPSAVRRLRPWFRRISCERRSFSPRIVSRIQSTSARPQDSGGRALQCRVRRPRGPFS